MCPSPEMDFQFLLMTPDCHLLVISVCYKKKGTNRQNSKVRISACMLLFPCADELDSRAPIVCINERSFRIVSRRSNKVMMWKSIFCSAEGTWRLSSAMLGSENGNTAAVIKQISVVPTLNIVPIHDFMSVMCTPTDNSMFTKSQRIIQWIHWHF